MPDDTTQGSGRGPNAAVPAGERELIVIASRSAGLRARGLGPASLNAVDVSPLAQVLASAGARLKPLFGPSEEHVSRRAAVAAAAPDAPPAPDNLDLYYRVECADSMMDEMAEKLRDLPMVEAAYVKPPAQPAVELLNAMPPRAADAPPATPDFTGRQVYLGAAPAGVDARFAWTVPGGGGSGVRIIDVEGAWRFTHEDLTQNQGGAVGGTPTTDIGWRNHGTAVIGVFSGDRNNIGVTGICPDANVRGISIFGDLGTSGAITRAADLLGPGDIILIELHRPGPAATGQGQEGFIAIEWWPDDYDAIRYAVSRGVIVVEAAGNGAQDLDSAIYDTPSAGFPPTWSNPFRRGARDSGAILVGAGAPPVGTHGADHGPDRSRLDFSNYGSAVDAQGWGREVTTCGYGDLQGGANEDLWYTDQFSGTSSASPVIVGSLACVQGVLRARGLTLLTPSTARAQLRNTGSPQQDAPGRPATQRIGRRPDVKEMITRLSPRTTVPLHRYWNAAIADHFYTTNFAELRTGGHGWRYEGVQCYVHSEAGPGLTALHRYWNAGIGDHFYTTNFAELGQGAYGWHYEGVQCYVHAGAGSAGSTALYRYWNAALGDHFYTTNFAELGHGAYGWRFEGVQCYVDVTAGVTVAEEPTLALTAARPAARAFPMQLPAAQAQPSLAANGGGGMEAGPSFTLQSMRAQNVPETFSALEQAPSAFSAGPSAGGLRPEAEQPAASFATASAPLQSESARKATASVPRNGHSPAEDITIHIGRAAAP